MTAPVLPKDSAAFEEFLGTIDTLDKLREATTTKDADGETAFTRAVKSYVATQTAADAELQKMVQAETQAALTEMLKGNGLNKAEIANARLNLSARGKGNPRAKGAGLNGKFTDLGEFVQAVWHRDGDKARMPNAADLREKLGILNAYQEKVPADGGFLVPEEFRTQIISLSLETAIVRPRAVVIPMGTNTLSFPTVDATSNVSTVFGGLVVYRTEEGEEFVESKAKFGRIKLDTTKQTALAYVTNETIKDTGGALMAWLNRSLPEAFAWYEDKDYHNGTGAGEPLGGINAANPALIVQTKETNQVADTVLWENALRMYARMLPQSIGRAVWEAAPDVFVELATMALNVGTGGSAVWLTDAHGTPVLTLLGRPVIMTEKAPGVLGDQSDLSLIDWGMYYIGDREELSIDTSPHVKFTSDQTTIRAIQRNDGRPAVLNAITPANNGPTLSPFVTLGART
jgi:HK97 family phage major capsid protein